MIVAGASSLSMDTKNPRILYAATWQHRRLPWKVESWWQWLLYLEK
jgi:hypothetical protein